MGIVSTKPLDKMNKQELMEMVVELRNMIGESAEGNKCVMDAFDKDWVNEILEQCGYKVRGTIAIEAVIEDVPLPPTLPQGYLSSEDASEFNVVVNTPFGEFPATVLKVDVS